MGDQRDLWHAQFASQLANGFGVPSGAIVGAKEWQCLDVMQRYLHVPRREFLRRVEQPQIE